MADHGSNPNWSKRERDKRFNAQRPAWTAFYKTAEWRAKAKRQLEAEPFCRFHAKRGERVKATIADHIERHGGDRVKFFNGALQSLCSHCHNSIKQSMERKPRPVIGPDGWPIEPRRD